MKVALALAGLLAPCPVLPGARAEGPPARAKAAVSAPRAAAEPYRKRGEDLAKAGKLDLAIREYRSALSIDPTWADAHDALGGLYFAQGNFSQAIAAYRVALSQPEAPPGARYNLAYALRRSGRLPEAATEYRRFLALKPNDADGHYGLAETLKGLGEKGGARAAYERYIELEKRPEEARWVQVARAEIARFAKEGVAANAAALRIAEEPKPEPAAAPSEPAPIAAALPIAAPTTASATAAIAATALPVARALPSAKPLSAAAPTPPSTAPGLAPARPLVIATPSTPSIAPEPSPGLPTALPMAKPLGAKPAAPTPASLAPAIPAPALAKPMVGAPAVAAPTAAKLPLAAPELAKPTVAAKPIAAVSTPKIATPSPTSAVAKPEAAKPIATVSTPKIATPSPTSAVVKPEAAKKTEALALSSASDAIAASDLAGLASQAPKDTDGLLAQGIAAFRMRDYATARGRLEAAAKLAPKRADVHYRLAAARAASGDLRAAIDAWDTVTKLDPSNMPARDYAMRAREKLGLVAPIEANATTGAPAGAAAMERRHAREFARTGDTGHLLAQAEALIRAGRYEPAIRALLELAALRADASIPYFHLAACHRRLGDHRQGAYFARLYLRAVNAAEPAESARIRIAQRWASAPSP